ncbi:MAG: hypothetical protein WCH39_23745, partial [Schlesneria sp.]
MKIKGFLKKMAKKRTVSPSVQVSNDTKLQDNQTREQKTEPSKGSKVDDPNLAHRGRRPHVHVFGDLAELQLYFRHQLLPDNLDPSLTPYRRLRGFVKRTLPGGAWIVAQMVRAALRDVWKCDTELMIPFGEMAFTPTTADSDERFDWDAMVTYERTFDSEDPDRKEVRKETTTESRIVTQFSISAKNGKWAVIEGEKKSERMDAHGVEDTFWFEFAGNSDDAYHSFIGGELDVVAGYDNSENKPAMAELISDSDWPPSFNCWPTGDEVHLAIRFVDGSILFPSDASKNEYELTGSKIGEIWKQLSEDERRPLERFLEIDDEGKVSKLVILVDRDWKKDQRKFAGYAVVRPISVDKRANPSWGIWSSNCQVELNPIGTKTSDEFEKYDKFAVLEAVRLRLKFDASAKEQDT